MKRYRGLCLHLCGHGRVSGLLTRSSWLRGWLLPCLRFMASIKMDYFEVSISALLWDQHDCPLLPFLPISIMGAEIRCRLGHECQSDTV